MKIKESLNVTFDETPPPSKTSPLVDDDLDEEETIKFTEKKILENDIQDETLEIDEIVNKDSKPMKILMSSDNKLTKDKECESVDCTKYQGMAPKTSHLEAVKSIFQYIKGTTYLGLWYPKGADIETVVYADSDHAEDYVERKSTSGICTFVGCFLTSWFLKKQIALAISTTEAEYISSKKAYQQSLWMKQALIDYDDIQSMCDNKGAIDLSKNQCNTLEPYTLKFVTTFFVIMSRKHISLLKKCCPSTILPTFLLNPLNVNR
nr:retrovirus-related Pol polyprotein from transposon TNT 1-94 [Tanacetum cinerariifolium]